MPAAWSRLLAAPARAGWTANDLNMLVGDWLGTGHRIPDTPHKPIGLLGAILRWHTTHNTLDVRPAALDDAREADERETASQAPESDDDAQGSARPEPAALDSPGRAAAMAEAARLAQQAARRRTETAAADAAALEAKITDARTVRRIRWTR